MQCKTRRRHDACLYHTYHADMIPVVSILFQTALSTSTHRLAAHLVSVLTNHDTGSYDTVYEVDSGSSDVVIYWTMTGTHLVQIDSSMVGTRQLHLAISYQTAHSQIFVDFQHTERPR